MVVSAQIPEHLEGAFHRYLEHGILPGGFLLACLENDLTEAVCRADAINIRLLPEIVSYLLQAFPTSAWGSREAVHEWVIERKRGV